MQNHVLKTNKINKRFNRFSVLHDITISIKKGKIYGLIGKNGAGKTTLMRIIMGLSIPSSGEYELFGCRNRENVHKGLKKVGCLIESAGLNENMTAKENLTLHKIIRGIKDQNKDDQLLGMVGLKDTGNKKVKDFSLGMKQRLGISVALLGAPELLILDEPVNGLDPLGVVEIRNLIKKLCEEQGITILMSSHNLAELYQTATDYIIIDEGVIKKTISLADLEEECQRYFSIKTRQLKELISILEEELKTTNYQIMDDGDIRLFDYVNQEEMVAETLLSYGIVMTKFVVEGRSLENYFASQVGGRDHA